MPKKTLFPLANQAIEQALSAWHATPVSVDDAVAWLQDQPRAESDPLTELIARFWRTPGHHPEFIDAIRHATDDNSRALLELVYGQLLLAVRMHGAFSHLDRGFSLAAKQLGARDYLTVLNRHDALRWLVLSSSAMEPMRLDELLCQAEVTRHLRASGGEDPRFAPDASRRPEDDDPEHREDTIG